MRVRGGEVIEEIVAPFQQIVGDPVVLKQQLLRQPAHTIVGTGYVADLGRRIDPRQEGMNARGAPGKNRDRLQLLPGIRWHQLRLRKRAGDEGLYSDVLG